MGNHWVKNDKALVLRRGSQYTAKSCKRNFTVCFSYLNVPWCCELHNQPQIEKFFLAMAPCIAVKGLHFTLS